MSMSFCTEVAICDPVYYVESFLLHFKLCRGICFTVQTLTSAYITITCPCDLYPLTPHFYIVKLAFTRLYIIFLFLL